jgi:hypothetical protein
MEACINYTALVSQKSFLWYSERPLDTETQWRKTMTRMVLALMLTLALQAVNADVLIIDEVRQAGRMDLPVNGQNKAAVEAKFGVPVQKLPPVGDPPISSWKYDTYSVYFEYDLVLFSVLHPGAVVEK